MVNRFKEIEIVIVSGHVVTKSVDKNESVV